MNFPVIPLAPSEKRIAKLEGGSSGSRVEATGHICYNHTWWATRRLDVSFGPHDFVLATDSQTGAVTVSYGFDSTVTLSEDGPC